MVELAGLFFAPAALGWGQHCWVAKAMSGTASTSSQRLATPITYVKGVGPDRAPLFYKLGVRNVAELLFHFPRDYQDLTDLRAMEELEDGATLSVIGTVEDIDQRTTASGTITGVLIRQGENHVRGVWFNQAYLRQKFRVGQTVVFSGKVQYRGLAWEMAHPRTQWLQDGEEANGEILPIYPLCDGLKQEHVRRAMRHALDTYLDDLDEVFPAEYLQAHQLWPLKQALPQVHFPSSMEDLQAARRRFIYQELLVMQLGLALRRQITAQQSAVPLPATGKIDARILRLFPFELTSGQREVVAAVAADMARSRPMNRLLQGDVGSGKTVVAVYAMLLAVAHGCQAALMAPTEVLARQHFETLKRMLHNSHVRVGLLAGSLTAKERQQTLTALAAGEIDVVVGTQALVQDGVQFAKLALVVIDEQHKFGVKQRAVLRGSGLQPHYLVMTATPIPRTISMTQFGDLDVSTLRDSPPGRKGVKTYLVPEEKRETWWEFFRSKLREGRQGYVVTPRVEQTEDNPASVEERFASLANGELEAFRLAMVHGRMSPDEKEACMAAFRRGEIQVLVCTTVVEVGVDVPNATLMVIEAAESFGLSQLHQLRGRVSRGTYQGMCGLFADPQNEESLARLEAFVATTDGFELAELDFKQRGPGNLFSTQQHGMPPLYIADLARDRVFLEEARRDAQQLVDIDPGLANPELERLRRMVLRRYGRVLELGDVG